MRWGCLMLAAVASLPGFALLRVIWSQSDYFGHGYLIPPVCLGLIFMRRDEVVRAVHTGASPAVGPALVLASALLLSAAVAGEIVTIAGTAIPILLGATAFAVAGWSLLRPLLLPLGFMLLMVPTPRFFEDRILLHLTHLVAQISSASMQALGYPVARIGNRILIPGQELFVEGACSGLTSVITLIPLAVVVAYFLSHGVWRRITIVASIIPIAMLFNIARVTITIAIVHHYGIEQAQGLLHEGLGIATFIGGTLVLVGMARVLR